MLLASVRYSSLSISAIKVRTQWVSLSLSRLSLSQLTIFVEAISKRSGRRMEDLKILMEKEFFLKNDFLEKCLAESTAIGFDPV